MDLRKQKVPYTDSKAIQQIKFIDFKDKNTTFCAIEWRFCKILRFCRHNESFV